MQLEVTQIKKPRQKTLVSKYNYNWTGFIQPLDGNALGFVFEPLFSFI
jgi:hypothetical protein